MSEHYRVAMVKADYCRPSGMYAWEWVNQNSPFEITVFVSDPSGFSHDDLHLGVVALPMLDHRWSVAGHSAAGLLRRLGLPIRYLQGLGRLLADYDIIISVEDGALFGLTCALYKHENKLVIYSDENIQHPPYRNRWGIRLAERFVRGRADHFFATTLMTKRRFIYDGIARDEISVVPYAIPPDLFLPEPKNPQAIGLPERLIRDFVVLFSGRLSIWKGVPWLMEAARQLIPMVPDITFVFVGGKEMQDETFEDFRAAFADRVFYLGMMDHRSLRTVYNTCDVLILPSIPTPNWDEQFGMVLLEAMACGKPAIASHTGGIPYVLSPDSAILVDYCSSEALTLAILTLYHDRSRLEQMSRAAHRFFGATYTDEVVGKKIVRELERLVQAPI
jgi:glycosyltransferase involved in cell wall biosynthesis